MFGGVSPSDVWGEVPSRNTYRRKLVEQQLEIDEMKNQMAELKSQVLSQQRFISQQPQGSSSFPESLPGIILTKQTLRVEGFVILKSVFDSTKIVAKGFLQSTDTNEQVGGQALGENWCLVHVKVVLEPRESGLMILFKHLIEDAHGGIVA